MVARMVATGLHARARRGVDEMRDGDTLRAVRHGHCAGLLHAAHAVAKKHPEAAAAIVQEYRWYCYNHGLHDDYPEGSKAYGTAATQG